MSELRLVQIGTVRSAFKACAEVPLHGGPAVIELFPSFEEGLDDLAGSSHVVVMGFLHLADRGVLRVKPRKFDPEALERGVFSTRSPARPNPLSMTVVPLLGIDGCNLRVDHLDLVDGTPVVDLKAYCPGWDTVFAATHRRKTTKASLEEGRLGSFLQRDLANHLGEYAGSRPARLGLGAVFLAARALRVDPRDPALRVRVNRADASADAVMGLTGASFSNGRFQLEVGPGPLALRFQAGVSSVELVERPWAGPVEGEPARWAEHAFEIGEPSRLRAPAVG